MACHELLRLYLDACLLDEKFAFGLTSVMVEEDRINEMPGDLYVLVCADVPDQCEKD